MMRQFASACVVGGIAVACGAMAVALAPDLSLPQAAPMLAVWCVVPLIWGLWAALAPAGWIPERLPQWGGILGVVAGILAAFVVNMPWRVLGVELPAAVRLLLGLAMGVFYYALWMLVRKVYAALGGPASASSSATMPSSRAA